MEDVEEPSKLHAQRIGRLVIGLTQERCVCKKDGVSVSCGTYLYLHENMRATASTVTPSSSVVHIPRAFLRSCAAARAARGTERAKRASIVTNWTVNVTL